MNRCFCGIISPGFSGIISPGFCGIICLGLCGIRSPGFCGIVGQGFYNLRLRAIWKCPNRRPVSAIVPFLLPNRGAETTQHLNIHTPCRHWLKEHAVWRAIIQRSLPNRWKDVVFFKCAQRQTQVRLKMHNVHKLSSSSYMRCLQIGALDFSGLCSLLDIPYIYAYFPSRGSGPFGFTLPSWEY